MMSRILLVALRDFLQVVSRRGFLVTLLAVPLALAISGFVSSKLVGAQNVVAWTILDASGSGAGARVERRLELDYQRETLRNLSGYVERWSLASAGPGEPWAQRGAWASDAAVARFMSEGGVDAAKAKLRDRLPSGAAPFKPPTRYFVEVPAPKAAQEAADADAFGRAAAGPLTGDVQAADGKHPLALAVYIPKDFGSPGVAARAWTNGRYDGGLTNIVRQELTAGLRLRALQGAGIAPDVAQRIETLQAPIAVIEPPPGGGRSAVTTKSLAPLALVYLLLMSALTTGGMMLQGLIEERSNKLLESVLACIRPEELMYGKLIGLGAVGLTVVAVWAGCAIAAAFLSPGFIADALKPSLTAIGSPVVIAAMIFFFLSGYLVIAMLFLAIGSISDSVQDAQAYLMPVMMGIMLPVVFIIQATIRTPDSAFVHVVSWIPIYTPFAMLARMGTGVPPLEMLAASAVLAAFMVVEVVLLGRLFRSSLLSTGQPTRAELFARLMARSAG